MVAIRRTVLARIACDAIISAYQLENDMIYVILAKTIFDALFIWHMIQGRPMRRHR